MSSPLRRATSSLFHNQRRRSFVFNHDNSFAAHGQVLTLAQANQGRSDLDSPNGLPRQLSDAAILSGAQSTYAYYGHLISDEFNGMGNHANDSSLYTGLPHFQGRQQTQPMSAMTPTLRQETLHSPYPSYGNDPINGFGDNRTLSEIPYSVYDPNGETPSIFIEFDADQQEPAERFAETQGGQSNNHVQPEAYTRVPSLPINQPLPTLAPHVTPTATIISASLLSAGRPFLPCNTCRGWWPSPEDLADHATNCPVTQPTTAAASPAGSVDELLFRPGFYCPVPDCKRSKCKDKPFTRKDNARNHIRTVHYKGRIFPDSPQIGGVQDRLEPERVTP